MHDLLGRCRSRKNETLDLSNWTLDLCYMLGNPNTTAWISERKRMSIEVQPDKNVNKILGFGVFEFLIFNIELIYIKYKIDLYLI
jgi:hypothetical protein